MTDKADMKTSHTDKLKFTLSFQLMKATEDLLAEVLATDYEGYVGIIAEVTRKPEDENAVLDVKLKRFGTTQPKKAPQNCAVFHVIPSKGAKRIV